MSSRSARGHVPTPQSTTDSYSTPPHPHHGGGGGEFDADLLARAPEISKEQRQAGYDESLLHRHRTHKSEGPGSNSSHDFHLRNPPPLLPGMRVASPTGSNYSSIAPGSVGGGTMPPGAAPSRHPTVGMHHHNASRASSTDKLTGAPDLVGSHHRHSSANLLDGREVYSSLGGRVTPNVYPGSNSEKVPTTSPKLKAKRNVDNGAILQSGSRRKPWFKRPFIIAIFIIVFIIIAVAVAIPLGLTLGSSNKDHSTSLSSSIDGSGSCTQSLCFATGPVAASPTTNTGAPTNLQPIGGATSTADTSPISNGGAVSPTSTSR